MKFKVDDLVIWDPKIKNFKPILCVVTGAYTHMGQERYTVTPADRARTWLVKDASHLTLAPKPKKPRKSKLLTVESAEAQIEAAVEHAGGTFVSGSRVGKVAALTAIGAAVALTNRK